MSVVLVVLLLFLVLFFLSFFSFLSFLSSAFQDNGSEPRTCVTPHPPPSRARTQAQESRTRLGPFLELQGLALLVHRSLGRSFSLPGTRGSVKSR